MSESVKKILAYQRTPLVVTCEQSGELADDFLVNLTAEEQDYVLSRASSPLEPVFYELLPQLGAAGILSTASPLLLDVHRSEPALRASVDGISLPLAAEESTQEYLVREFYEPYAQHLSELAHKTEQRFGSAHVVHFALLPRFVDGARVEHDIVSFGTECLEGAVHEPDELSALYAEALVREYETHTWIGVHPKLFSTHTLRREVVERLSEIKAGIVAKR